jgi:protein-tyrosine-phosphatase
MFNRILTVCTGNICRSPAAEFFLRQRIEALGRPVEAQSAGIGALVNHPADETTCAMMQSRGVDLSAHRGSQLVRERLRWAELVLVMEQHHRDAVLALDPDCPRQDLPARALDEYRNPRPLSARRRSARGSVAPDRSRSRALGRKARLNEPRSRVRYCAGT